MNPWYSQPDDEMQTLNGNGQPVGKADSERDPFKEAGPEPEGDTTSDPNIKELINRYGFPAFKNEKGKISKLNEPFWAAYHAACEQEALFEANEEAFYYYDE